VSHLAASIFLAKPVEKLPYDSVLKSRAEPFVAFLRQLPLDSKAIDVLACSSQFFRPHPDLISVPHQVHLKEIDARHRNQQITNANPHEIGGFRPWRRKAVCDQVNGLFNPELMGGSFNFDIARESPAFGHLCAFSRKQ
jgi:hypothetical protein